MIHNFTRMLLFILLFVGYCFSAHGADEVIVIKGERLPEASGWRELATSKNSDVELNSNTLLVVGNTTKQVQASVFRIEDGAKIVAFKTKRALPHNAHGTGSGDHGTPGGHGMNAGSISIDVVEWEGDLEVDLRGQNGGNGGNGISGTNGSPGFNRQIGSHCCDWHEISLPWGGRIRLGCRNYCPDYQFVPPTNGTDGGNAGAGGNSGDGGNLEVRILDGFKGCITARVNAGTVGNNGVRGNGGSPGGAGARAGEHGSLPSANPVSGTRGVARLLSLTHKKEERYRLISQLSLLQKNLKIAKEFAGCNETEAYKYPVYNSWFLRRQDWPYQLFNQEAHGQGELGDLAWRKVLQNPKLSPNNIQLLRELRSEYLTLDAYEAICRDASSDVDRIHQEIEDKDKNLKNLSDWSTAKMTDLIEGERFCIN